MRDRSWLNVTILVDGWTIPPGEYRAFGPLRDHPNVKAFLGRMRRLKLAELVIFGSIEVIFKTVANQPAGKFFHLHLMISGADELKVKEAVRSSFELDPLVAIPYLPQVVGTGETDFVKAASYVFKQPFWKSSYPVPNGSRRWKQFPKPNELAELIACLGAHPWNGRLIMVGMRFDRGTFRLT